MANVLSSEVDPDDFYPFHTPFETDALHIEGLVYKVRLDGLRTARCCINGQGCTQDKN